MADDPVAIEPHALAALLHIEQRAFAASTPAALGFTITNEAVALVAYRQAAFFTSNSLGKLVLSIRVQKIMAG